MHTHFQGISSNFGPWSNLVKPRPKRLHFFPISSKSNLKVDLDTHLRGTHIFVNFKLFWHLVKVGQNQVLRNALFLTFSKLKFETIFRYTFERCLHVYFWGISIHFGSWSNFIKPRPKMLHFFQFLKTQILK